MSYTLGYTTTLLFTLLSLGNCSENPDSIKFLLYRIPNDTEAYQELIYLDKCSLGYFNSSWPSVFLMDGYGATYKTAMNQEIKDAILTHDKRNLNVIVVDHKDMMIGYSDFVSDYFRICEHIVPLISRRIAELLHFVYPEELNGNQSGTHLIGHSLGVPIAAQAGRFYQSMFGRNVSRITGLDGAGPYYYFEQNKHLQLQKGDAAFVDIYHTDRGFAGVMGQIKGDINVYVNGGQHQEHCPSSSSLAAYPIQGGESALCSHWYSWFLFKESLTVRFIGCPCSGRSCFCLRNCESICGPSSTEVEVQYYISPSAEGDIYLYTTHGGNNTKMVSQ